jgi:hypothetical protein
VEGTQFVPGAWFQYQLRPGLRFFRKGECPGIELADTIARTVADHYNSGEAAVPHWTTIVDRLYCGHLDRSAKWGCYKEFPARGADK